MSTIPAVLATASYTSIVLSESPDLLTNIVLTKEIWDIRVQSFNENTCSYTENHTTIPGFGMRQLVAMGMVHHSCLI